MIFDFTKKKEEQPGRKTAAAAQNPGKKRRMREGEYPRYRDCQIAFRVTKEEKEMAVKRFRESRFDKFQNYAIDALIHPMPDDETIKDYAILEEQLDKLYVQLRGMATNINQMAKKANSDGTLPELEQLDNVVLALRGEVDEAWQSIRYQLHGLQVMQR